MSNWTWVISYEEHSIYSGLRNESCAEIKDQIASIINGSSFRRAATDEAQMSQ